MRHRNQRWLGLYILVHGARNWCQLILHGSSVFGSTAATAVDDATVTCDLNHSYRTCHVTVPGSEPQRRQNEDLDSTSF